MSDTLSQPTKTDDPVTDRVIRDLNDSIQRLLNRLNVLEFKVETLERKIKAA